MPHEPVAGIILQINVLKSIKAIRVTDVEEAVEKFDRPENPYALVIFRMGYLIFARILPLTLAKPMSAQQ